MLLPRVPSSQAKQVGGSGISHCRHFPDIDPKVLRYARRNHGNAAALIAPPAERHRRKIWRIGFKQYAAQSNLGQHGRHLRPLESNHAVYTKVEIAVATNAFYIIDSATETVEHPARQPVETVENFQHLVKPVAAMDNHRQVTVKSPLQLRGKNILLLLPVGFIPIHVYAYLPNCHKDIKAFYMRLNDDGKTVAAADCLVPGIGEIIGGSQREERLDLLEGRIKELGMKPEDYWWYLDLRRYGGTKHAGYGLGFERMIMYLTGVSNIRDVLPYPRTVGNAEF